MRRLRQVAGGPVIQNSGSYTYTRPQLPASSIGMTMLADNQPTYASTGGSAPSGQSDFAPNLANTFNLTTSSSPNHSYYNAPYNASVNTTQYTYPVYTMPEGSALQSVYITSTTQGALQAFIDANPVPIPDITQVVLGTFTATATSGSNQLTGCSSLPFFYGSQAVVTGPGLPANGSIITGNASGTLTVVDNLTLNGTATYAVCSLSSPGQDSELMIFMGNSMWEFCAFVPAKPGSAAANAGYAWQALDGAYTADVTTNFKGFYSADFSTPHGYVYAEGCHAAGCCGMFGLLMADDYYAGTINHALGVSWPITGQRPSGLDSVAPATRYDLSVGIGGSTSTMGPYGIPEGCWFRLPPGFDTVGWAAANNSHASSYVVEMVCRAIRDYGFMIFDSAGDINFLAEDTSVFGTQYNPFTQAQKPQWGNFTQNLPWSQMTQIAPRTAF